MTEPTKDEIETFREQLRSKGYSEQKINGSVVAMQMLGELPMGSKAESEIERFREQLRKEGKTEQQINVAVAQLQIVGELPTANVNLTLATPGTTRDERRATALAMFEKISGKKATPEQLKELDDYLDSQEFGASTGP